MKKAKEKKVQRSVMRSAVMKVLFFLLLPKLAHSVLLNDVLCKTQREIMQEPLTGKRCHHKQLEQEIKIDFTKRVGFKVTVGRLAQL